MFEQYCVNYILLQNLWNKIINSELNLRHIFNQMVNSIKDIFLIKQWQVFEDEEKGTKMFTDGNLVVQI